MTNRMLQEALIREHQHTLQRTGNEIRAQHGAQRVAQPQPTAPQPAQCARAAILPKPAMDLRH